MRILHRYLAASFLATFCVTLVVFTFVISLGVIFKVTDLLARGVTVKPILEIFTYGIPPALAFSIPVSALTTSLLVFGRLSSDGEIAAMKSCGISMWQIVSRPLLFALLATAACLYVNTELGPRSHFARRQTQASLGVETPLELIEEGRFLQDFAGLTIYIGKRKGTRVSNVRIYDVRRPGLKREIRAAWGEIRTGVNGRDLIIDLHDVRVDPFSEDRPGAVFCRRWPVTIPDALRVRTYRKGEKDYTLYDLIHGIVQLDPSYEVLDGADRARKRMSMLVELNKRLTLSALCFTFVLFGIPLGIKAHRKESSIGVAVSLFIVFNSYLFIILADSLVKRPELRPDLLVWTPVVISGLLGVWLIDRNN